jgi:hypothetical protein
MGAADRLRELSIEGVTLVPAFSPDVHDYRADVTLLRHTARVHAAAGAGATVWISGGGGASAEVTAEVTAELSVGLGETGFAVDVDRANRTTEVYHVAITRHDALWRDVAVLRDASPREDGFFGDYLRASSSVLYVNSARRGQLYRRQQAGWAFDRPAETLFEVPLEWMYEAAITDDTLALVAQPVGGDETLYVFAAAPGGGWRPEGAFVTGEQGTVRCWGSDLAFVSPAGVRVFRRAGTAWDETASIPAPAADVGFGTRPTYFDAPGVAMAEGTLVVGVPLADGGAEDAGGAFVYERDAAGAWSETARLAAWDPAPGLHFGKAAAIAGRRIAIGTGDAGGATGVQTGAVYLFEWLNGAWQPAGKITAGQPRGYDYFGDVVLLTGDTLLVGAAGHDGAAGAGTGDTGAPDTGGIFAFVRTSDGWSERGVFKLPGDLAPPPPFPLQMIVSDGTLLVPANTAGYAVAGAGILSDAGAVFYLH